MSDEEKKRYNFTYENLPDLKHPSKYIPIYFIQFFYFITLILFIWKISTFVWYGALLAQIIITIFAMGPIIYITTNIKSIRLKLKEKYKNRAFQNFYYKYLFFTPVPTFLSFYFPLILKTDYFLPNIIPLPENLFTKSIFPIYVALPLFFLFIFIGFLIRRPSGGFNLDVESYIFLIYPEKGKIINEGIYKYIRHPRYLGRIFVSLSFGFFANNILGLCVSVIHFSAFLILSFFEDNELKQRFEEEYTQFKKLVPGYIPKIKNWKPFLIYIFTFRRKS
jgi:protein-S-isoprenylcysteine O-methyltransferase Ste14